MWQGVQDEANGSAPCRNTPEYYPSMHCLSKGVQDQKLSFCALLTDPQESSGFSLVNAIGLEIFCEIRIDEIYSL